PQHPGRPGIGLEAERPEDNQESKDDPQKTEADHKRHRGRSSRNVVPDERAEDQSCNDRQEPAQDDENPTNQREQGRRCSDTPDRTMTRSSSPHWVAEYIKRCGFEGTPGVSCAIRTTE